MNPADGAHGAGTRVAGALEGHDAGVAVGWARDPARPGTRVVVEILCDGYPVAVDRADVFRPDLRAGPTDDGCCGFEIALPPAVMRHGRALTARVANTAVMLDGLLRIGEGRKASRRAIRGEVRSAGLRLTGWVNPVVYRGRTVRITASEEGVTLAEAVADRPALAGDDGPLHPRARRFLMRLPMHLADGRIHPITVRDDTGAELKGSPVVVAAWPYGASDTLWRLAETPGVPETVAREMQATSTVLGECHDVLRASVAFDAYADWKRAYPPEVDPGAAPALPVTVLLHGEGAEAAARMDFGPRVETLAVPDGRLVPEMLPATGAFAILRAGDSVVSGGVAALAAPIAEGHADIAYCDSEQVVAGTPRPWLKPDWDPDLFLGQGYVFGLVLVRAETLAEAAGRTLLERLVAVFAGCDAGRIAHVPDLLHRQESAEAHGAAPVPPGWRADRVAALWPGLGDAGGGAEALPQAPWLARVRWPIPEREPSVCVMIPTRDRVELLRAAVEGVLERTDYRHVSVLVLDNGSTEAATRAYLTELERRGVGVLPSPGPFNFSRLNNEGARATGAELLCLMNNDVEVIEPGWLAEMVSLLARPGTGAVGAKLLWREAHVQHGGVVLGIDGGAVHVGNAWTDTDPGYAGTNLVARRWSAVTAACLLLRRADYLDLGGLDEDAFPVAFNDVDLCLRLGAAGKAVVWTPHARLRHDESVSRGRDELPEKAARARRELENLRARWGGVLMRDPCYNPGLNRDGAPFEGLALPPARPRRNR